MKKRISTLLCLSLLFGLCGCNSVTPMPVSESSIDEVTSISSFITSEERIPSITLSEHEVSLITDNSVTVSFKTKNYRGNVEVINSNSDVCGARVEKKDLIIDGLQEGTAVITLVAGEASDQITVTVEQRVVSFRQHVYSSHARNGIWCPFETNAQYNNIDISIIDIDVQNPQISAYVEPSQKAIYVECHTVCTFKLKISSRNAYDLASFNFYVTPWPEAARQYDGKKLVIRDENYNLPHVCATLIPHFDEQFFEINFIFLRSHFKDNSHPKSRRVKSLLPIVTLLLCCFAAHAQSGEEHSRMDFYGYVVTADSLHPIRNTHIISKLAHYGTITNHQGKFHIQARQVDTLWVSCVGYQRRLVAIDSTLSSADTLVIRLRPETITLREVTVLPFTNYETFKEMLITMPSIETPDEIKRLNDDLDDLWLSRPPVGNGMFTVTASPIQYLYDKYNKSARRQATLLRNRRMYNEVLREQGRTDELLPDSLDFAINYKMYELDEAAEAKKNKDEFDTTNVVGKVKPMVPRRKYIRIGN